MRYIDYDGNVHDPDDEEDDSDDTDFYELFVSISDINNVLAANGLPECSNCKNDKEVLNAIRFVMHRCKSLHKRINAIKEVVNK